MHARQKSWFLSLEGPDGTRLQAQQVWAVGTGGAGHRQVKGQASGRAGPAPATPDSSTRPPVPRPCGVLQVKMRNRLTGIGVRLAGRAREKDSVREGRGPELRRGRGHQPGLPGATRGHRLLREGQDGDKVRTGRRCRRSGPPSSQQKCLSLLRHDRKPYIILFFFFVFCFF